METPSIDVLRPVGSHSRFQVLKFSFNSSVKFLLLLSGNTEAATLGLVGVGVALSEGAEKAPLN